MRFLHIVGVVSSLACLAAGSTGEKGGKDGKCKKPWIESKKLQADISTEKYAEANHLSLVINC